MKKYIEKFMNVKNTNKKLYYATITILVMVIGVTFAYVIDQISGGAISRVFITADTSDTLEFEVDKDIIIKPTQFNFEQGGSDLTDTATATARLKANSTDNTATYKYNVYFQITTNEYIYTTEDHKPEMILQVTTPNNEPLKEINGLTYNETLQGFDITTASGLFAIMEDSEITSNSSTTFAEQNWIITVKFVNLDNNQVDNEGKTLEAKILIQKKITFAEHIKSLYTIQGVNNLYHHDGTILDSEGNIMDSEDESYRYAGGNYKVADVYKLTYTDINKIIQFDNSSGSPRFYLAYETPVIYYNEVMDAVEKAIEDGYVEETQVNNYVCFGSDEEVCPEDNLYRIIGVFGDRVKLIKAYFATENQLGTDGDYVQNNGYRWNEKNYYLAYNEREKYNLWSYSELNKTNLNKNYLNNLGTKWSDMIGETRWYVGGMDRDNVSPYGDSIVTARMVYDYELGSSKNIASPYEPIEVKIGLMYVSEYYYASSQNYLSAIASNSWDARCAINNWMFMRNSSYEWTISPDLYSSSVLVFALLSHYITNTGVKDNYLPVRPTFNLKSSVTIDRGVGSKNNPYRIV